MEPIKSLENQNHPLSTSKIPKKTIKVAKKLIAPQDQIPGSIEQDFIL